MPVTNFPQPGDDKPVSLANSRWPLFPVGEAQELKDDWPGIWRRGGNIRGNQQFALLAPMARERRGPRTPAELRAVRLREAWVARHEGDYRLPGVVAQIKWLAIGSRGVDHMRKVISEAKDAQRGDVAGERSYLRATFVGAAPMPVAKNGEGYEDVPGPEVFTFIITNGMLDRQREIVDPNGWDFSAFERNPVILDGHASGSITDILGKGLPPLRRVGDDWLLDVVLSSCDKGQLARRLILEGALRTVSVGFVSKRRERDEAGVLVHREAELLEVSLVPIPANPAALLVGAKAAVPATEMPVDVASPWDGAAAEQAVRVWASSDGSGEPDTIDWGKYRQAFLHVDDGAEETLGGYHLPVATVRDGELVLVAAGVAAAAAALGGARGGVNIPEADLPGVMAALDRYREMVAEAREEAEEPEAEMDGYMMDDEEPGMKAGRVLSRQNEAAIRQAREMAMGLIEALDQLLAQVPDDQEVVEPGDKPEVLGESGMEQQQKLHNELATLLRAVMEG
jgi:hypothetical protein